MAVSRYTKYPELDSIVRKQKIIGFASSSGKEVLLETQGTVRLTDLANLWKNRQKKGRSRKFTVHLQQYPSKRPNITYSRGKNYPSGPYPRNHGGQVGTYQAVDRSSIPGNYCISNTTDRGQI
jgi:hypothetical protein